MGKRLQSLIKGKIKSPLKILIMGVEGVGKTTFAAESPNPIFIDLDAGSKNQDVERIPCLTDKWTYKEVVASIEELITDEHKHRTLVIDTLDRLEQLIWNYVCNRDRKENIEDYMFKQGYIVALDEWRNFLLLLETLIEKKGMNVLLVAHTTVKNFKNPIGSDFDRYQAKLHDKASALLREWVDAALFMNYETYTKKTKTDAKAKGVGGDLRVIYTERNAAWDAKNRFGLPSRINLSWEDFYNYTNADSDDRIKELKDKVKTLVEKINDNKITEWAEEKLKSSLNTDYLLKIINKLNSKAEELEEKITEVTGDN